MNKLQVLMGKSSFGKIGRACGVSKQAAAVWFRRGKLPDTEFLPEGHPRKTNHAATLAKHLNCSPADLLSIEGV